MRAENSMLKQKIEDIRIIDRAKCILISHFGMVSKSAPVYRKHAMIFVPRRWQEGILKMYEN